MIKIKKYDLPDAELLTGNGTDPIVWVPERFCIVLGQSNEPGESIHTAVAEEENIPVYKRPSGGETVILSPNTLVMSFVKRNEPLRSPKRFFSLFNGTIIDSLTSLGVKGLGQKGISDICIGEKKILGSSIYRNKNLLLYHAVLNISEPVSNMEKYLKHPSREPDYRAGRSHADFVTSLAAEGYVLSVEAIRAAISIIS
jgi:lipoate-protein ligase A